jgi:pilus assembly protein Flp/PilA
MPNFPPVIVPGQQFKQDRALALFTRLQTFAAELVHDQRGQGLTEYALILALIAVVAIAALSVFGGKVTSVLTNVAHSV